MKKNWCFILIFCCSFVLYSQVHKDSISYEFFAKKELKQIVDLKKPNQKASSISTKNLLKIAHLYSTINIEDSAYANYYKVYENEQLKKSLSSEEYKQLLFDIHIVESSKNYYSKDRRFFLNELRQLSQKDSNDKWITHYNYELAKDYVVDSVDFKKAENYFKKVFNSGFYRSDSKFRGKVLSSYGCFKTLEKSFPEADQALRKSFSLSKKTGDTQTQFYNLLNLAVNYIDQKKFDAGLHYLEQAGKIPIKKFRLKSYRLLYMKRADAYYGLKNDILYKENEAIFNSLDSVLSDFKKNNNFYEIDVKHQVKDQQRQIETMETNFNHNKIIYSILIFIVFLLALYSFVRWKKVDLKKKKLLLEKSQIENLHSSTVEELEMVKQLVIEDHIILKNKSKIYLDELIFIQSDDHYLKLITTSKKEFVRGKLTEIIKNLPPNFIKCHRSFIINKNFILQTNTNSVIMTDKTEIPLSRGFKIE